MLRRHGEIRESVHGVRDAIRKRLNMNGRRVLSYVGALGGWYLTSEMADFIAVAKAHDPAIFALVLTQSVTQAETFKSRLSQLGLSPGDYWAGSVLPNEVAWSFGGGRLRFLFYKTRLFKSGFIPNKNRRIPCSGLPVLCKSGIGDVDNPRPRIVLASSSTILIGRLHRGSSSLRNWPRSEMQTTTVGGCGQFFTWDNWWCEIP